MEVVLTTIRFKAVLHKTLLTEDDCLKAMEDCRKIEDAIAKIKGHIIDAGKTIGELSKNTFEYEGSNPYPKN